MGNMKFLHIADLHIGAKNSKLPKAQQTVLTDEMFEKIHYFFNTIAPEFDAVVICGDLFHSKNVSAKIEKHFFACVDAYAKPVIYIVGNHDEKTDFSCNCENFIVLNKLNPKVRIEDTVFHCKCDNITLEEGANNVLLLHGNIESSQDNDYVDIAPYLAMNFDYIALGHTHQVKKFKKKEKIFAYSGSLFSNGFDETGDKGYIEVEIAQNEVKKCNFVPLKQRKYQLCEVDISTCNSNGEIVEQIRRELSNKNIDNSDIVRVVLKGSHDELLVKSESIILQALEDLFYVEIKDQSKMKVDIEKLKTETLSLKNEFISLVENSALTDEQKQKIIALGIEALKGDDLSL